MPLELRQTLNLKQTIIMTQYLQQAIHLLQLSHTDLIETVNRELMQNPMLEERIPENRDEVKDDRSDIDSLIYEKEIADSADLENYLGEFSSLPKSMHLDLGDDNEGNPIEECFATRPTLEGHLRWQLWLSDLSEAEKIIGEEIIGNLNSKGFLNASLEDIAQLTGKTVDDVSFVLKKIQKFDPIGVAARSIIESLLIQIDSLGYFRDRILVDIVSSYLDDLEKHNYQLIMRKLKIDEEILKDYITIIKSLDPMPGAHFSSDPIPYIIPDAYIFKLEGKVHVVLNDDDLPVITLSNECRRLAKEASGEDKKYFSEKLRSANLIIKTLQQRQTTLLRVIECIVKHQEDFFNKGASGLKPLILRDIADDLNMHESTISRVTSNKYVSTEFGVLELKYFFSGALASEDGNEITSKSVKMLLEKLIAEEAKKNPLSDSLLAEKINAELNTDISRRTVAKYRMAIGIPSSSKRKILF